MTNIFLLLLIIFIIIEMMFLVLIQKLTNITYKIHKYSFKKKIKKYYDDSSSHSKYEKDS
jgi:uncharacterized protein HemY